MKTAGGFLPYITALHKKLSIQNKVTQKRVLTRQQQKDNQKEYNKHTYRRQAERIQKLNTRNKAEMEKYNKFVKEHWKNISGPCGYKVNKQDKSGNEKKRKGKTKENKSNATSFNVERAKRTRKENQSRKRKRVSDEYINTPKLWDLKDFDSIFKGDTLKKAKIRWKIPTRTCVVKARICLLNIYNQSTQSK